MCRGTETLQAQKSPSHCHLLGRRDSSSYGLECGAPGAPEPPLCFDPCRNYTVLDDPSRSTEDTERAQKCDTALHGWFRFVGEGGVRMPEKCPSTYRCQTEAPMWLSGAHPAPGEGTVTRTVCAHWSGNCCYWNTKIQVKACPDNYYVYQLDGSPACNLRYCTGEWQRPPRQLRGGALRRNAQGSGEEVGKAARTPPGSRQSLPSGKIAREVPTLLISQGRPGLQA